MTLTDRTTTNPESHRSTRGPRVLAGACASLALLAGLFTACDEDELAEEAAVPEPALAAAPASEHEPEAAPAPQPIMGDGMDGGPDVFAGSWSPGQGEKLVGVRDWEAALLAPELDPEVLRSHGAEPLQDLKIADVAVAGTISSPAGYGHYCSMTWPSGGWALAWDTNGNDPCAFLIANSDPGGTIQRAGMFSAAGTNQVVTRCSDGLVSIWRGAGSGPLSAAFAAADNHPGCIHTAAPQSLPIFQHSPLPSGAAIHTRTGIDFARGSITSLNTFDFGHASAPFANSSAQVVDFKGRARSLTKWIDGHDAYDYNVARGTEVYAVANGNVIASRWLDTKCTGSDGPVQGEVYIRHTVARNPSTYNETFVAGYFHLQLLIPLAPGADVGPGDLLGHSGNLGCTDAPHLHFAVIRETNVADRRFFTLQVPLNQGNNGWARTIDPYGWFAPLNIDPWGWRAYPNGALSINLWAANAAPPQGDWGAGID